MAQSVLLLPGVSARCLFRTGPLVNQTKCSGLAGVGPVNLPAYVTKLALSSKPLHAISLRESDHVWFRKRVRVSDMMVVRASDDEGGTFNWSEGSIVIPKFDENFNPVDESGSVIEVPSPRGVKKKKERTLKLDADGNPIEKKIRRSKAKKTEEKEEDSESDEKGPRVFRTAKDIAHEAEVAAAKAKAKRKAAQKKALEAKEAAAVKQLEGGEEGGAETSRAVAEGELEAGETKVAAEIPASTDASEPPPDLESEADPEPPEVAETRAIAELESREADLTESERRTLQTLKRSRKGRLQSQLREYALKQMSPGKMEEKRAALLKAAERAEARWHVVHCTAPEGAVAEDFQKALAIYAPGAEVEIRTPELPHVRFLKNGEPRRYSTFLRNNVVFVRTALTAEVKRAMSFTKGMYNIEGADRPDAMGGAPRMEAERFIEMIDEAERKVSAEIAAMAAKLEKEKAEAAARKKGEAVAKDGKADAATETEATHVPEEAENLEAVSSNSAETSESSEGGKYAPGSYVTVARGPFAGLPGKVTERNTVREELKVEIIILGQPSEATVKFKDVRPAKAPPASSSSAFDPFRRTDSTNGTSRTKQSGRSGANWAENGSDGLGNGLGGFRSDSDGSRGDSDGLNSERDGLGRSSEGFAGIPEGLRKGLGGGVNEEDDDETDRVPLRSGVGLVIKKGPFKGCTGHVVDVLLEKGLISVQIPDEGEIRLQPVEVEPEQGGRWSLPPGFQAITAPVRKPVLAKPKKQLLWLDEDDADEPAPKPKLGPDGRPTDPDWLRFEKKPRGLENDLRMDGADPRQGEIAWQKVSVKTPEGRPKRVLVKYLGTNTANTAEMLLVEDLDVMTAVWRRLKSARGAGSGQKRSRKKKDEKSPAFL